MNQNPTVDNDLQKAIDDITKNTNSDPVFADPVATPAPAPQNSAKPTPPRAPVPRPRPSRQAPMMPPAPRPAAPSGMPPMPPAPKMAEPAISEPPIPAPRDTEPNLAPMEEEDIMTESINAEIDRIPAPTEFAGSSDISELKEDILRSLLPEMDNISLSPSEKFDIYRSAIDDLHDSSVIGSALNTAKNITDDQERGEALLHLFDVVKGL